MNYKELEIKILKIDKVNIIKKLKELGAKYDEERIQKIYTYDCYEPLLMYKLALDDYKITKSKNSLQKIKNVIEYFKPTFTNEEKEYIKTLFGYEDICEYISKNYKGVDLKKLKDKRLLSIIKDTKNRFFKWIRLRQDGKKVELTIKYIYNTSVEYEIDQVMEYEIVTDDFETANRLVEEMGYYHRKLVEKKRTTFKYNKMNIEIDEWPLLEPYIEIEGKNVEDIYELAEELGYSKEETKVMNTEDVYLEKGIDLTKYEIMAFDKQIKV